jgi:methionyl-tRNA formyltransferase
VNLHPGLNPYNRGWYPQAFSIVNGLPAGATIHIMDREIDHGDVIDQSEVEVKPHETSLEVYNKILEAEEDLIRKNIKSIVSGSYETRRPCGKGNYNGIKDYRKLCELDLEHYGTLREHLDTLIALTHKGFKNAYFRNDDKKKIYVSIMLELEDASQD